MTDLKQILLTAIIMCENCRKKLDKRKALKVPECYFNGDKKFYVCDEKCLQEFLSAFR